MSEPKKYRFATFQELIDRVPSDRILDCMEELGVLLSATKASVELAHMVAANMAKEKGETVPELPQRLIVLPPELEWIDDWKGDIEAKILDPNNAHLFSIKICRD